MMKPIYIFLLMVAGLSCLHIRATDYYVAMDGDDQATGLATNTAWRSIPTAVHRLNAGDTLWIREGEYRGKVEYTNKNGRAAAPITIRSYPGESAVLKGSVVVTGWQHYGAGVWRQPAWGHKSQQVFADGVRLTQLGWPNEFFRSQACSCSLWIYLPFGYSCADIQSGGMGFNIPDPRGAMPENSFWYDEGTGDLYVRLAGGADPNAREMEVSTENGVFYDISTVGFLHLEDLTFMHSSTLSYVSQGWPVVRLGPDSLIRNCSILDGDGSGLWISNRSRAESCLISGHGILGISMNTSIGFVVDGCEVAENNYRQVHLEYAGGMKFIPDCAGIVQNCIVRDNFANGIWFDTCNSGYPIVVRNNIVIRNSPATGRNADVSLQPAIGIFIEYSSNAQVYGNFVSDTAGMGISASAARNVRIFNNTIRNTRSVAGGGQKGLYALRIDRASPQWPVEDIQAYNNLFVDNACDYDLVVPRPAGYLARLMEIDNNLAWRSTPGGTIAPNARMVFAYGGATYNNLAAWRSLTGFDLSSLSTPPLLDASCYPLAGSPVIDAGSMAHIPSWLDASGLRGTDGDGDGIALPDIGAYEYLDPSRRVLYVDAASVSPLAPYTNSVNAASALADALLVAQAGDTILIQPGEYPVEEELVVGQDIFVRGAGLAAGPVLFSGSGTNRIFRMNSPGALLENVTLSNGHADRGGGVLLEKGRVQDCRIENCSAENGGGIWAASNTVVRSTTITGCSANESGGGLWLDDGAFAESCTLGSNSAGESGGGAVLSVGAKLLSSTLRQNQAAAGGGAKIIGGTLDHCVLNLNTASQGGAGRTFSQMGRWRPVVFSTIREGQRPEGFG